MKIRGVTVLLPLALLLAAAHPARAQNQATGPPPQAPAAGFPDDSVGVRVRAVYVPGGLSVDGRLDEPVYAQTPPISDFIQQEPSEGLPVTEKTDVWVFFDDRNVYV